MFHYLCLAMLKFKLFEYLNDEFDKDVDGLSSLKCCWSCTSQPPPLIDEQMKHFHLCLSIVRDHTSGVLQSLFQPVIDYATLQVYDSEWAFEKSMLKEYMPRYKVSNIILVKK